MDWYIFVIFAAIVLVSLYFNIVPNELVGGVAVMFTLGIIFGEIGEKIPVWNKYFGGGTIFTFLCCGIITYLGFMPQNAIEVSKGWMDDYSFLHLFICFLVVGSLLSIDRKLLIKSALLYLPDILASLAGATLLGILGGLLFGKGPVEIIISYVLPIMGGGAGAGAIPLASVYEDVTGMDSSGYLSFALAILAVGNIISVLFAVILDNIGRVFPKLTGNGELVRHRSKTAIKEEKEINELKTTGDDIAVAIFLTGAFFVLAQLMAKKILPTIFGIAIPNFAYLIIFAALANVLNFIPENIKAACHKCQEFCASKLIWIQMAGVGITLIDFREIIHALSPANVTIALLIVLGCVLGSALFGWLIGFYPIESAITAGLCMANMGGAGDLAVLGAARRMDLISYAQISSRIGGAIVMLIGSFVFQFL